MEEQTAMEQDSWLFGEGFVVAASISTAMWAMLAVLAHEVFTLAS